MRTALLRAFAAFCLVLLFAVPAFATDTMSTLAAIDDFAIATGIDAGQRALYQTYALFDPSKLPEALRIESRDKAGWFCATPTIFSIREATKNASPQIREEILGYLPYFDQQSFGPPIDAKAGLAENPEGGDYFTSNSYKTDHFNFKWGTDSTYTYDDMVHWGEIFEEIWDVEVVEWGWDPVYLTDQYYIDVYLGNSGDDAPAIGFTGAYTTVYYNGQPLMVFHPDILTDDTYIKDVSSHEFFHTMQFTIIFKDDGCWGYMSEESNWGVEGTAVWAEDEIYDDINAYRYQIYSYADNPHYALTSSVFAQVYSRVIWWKYFSENLYGRDAIYDLWNDGCHGSLFNSADVIFKDNGSSVEQEYPKFTIANLFKDYEEGSSYPDFHIHETVTSYPASYEAEHRSLPQVYGTNYIELQAPDSKNGDDSLFIEFSGETTLSGRNIDWNLQVLAMKDASDYDLTTLTASNGVAQGTISDFGTTYDKVYLIISVISDRTSITSGAEYTVDFSVGATPADDDDDDDETDDDDDDSGTPNDDDDDDDDDNDSGCGC